METEKAEPVDYEDAFIIFAATNDPVANQEVVRYAGPSRLVNVVDQPTLGSFTVPAVARRGRLVLSVSTGGASPILAKRIRNDLLAAYPEDYAGYTEFLFYCREKLKNGRLPLMKSRNFFMKCRTNSTFALLKNNRHSSIHLTKKSPDLELHTVQIPRWLFYFCIVHIPKYKYSKIFCGKAKPFLIIYVYMYEAR